MPDTTVYDRVAVVIAARAGIDTSMVTPMSSLVDDLGLDSLDLLQLGLELESEFGLTIGDESLSRLETVGDIAAYITLRSAPASTVEVHP